MSELRSGIHAVDELALVVAPCTHDAARYAVLRWHYSARMPKSKLVKYGAWEHGRFVGALLFGWGGTPDILRPYGLSIHEGCELLRVALDRHDAPVTQIIARALRRLRTENPGLRLVVSFADPAQGHVGRIYQAGGWIYLGKTSPAHEHRIGSRILHGRTVRHRYGSVAALLERYPNAERVVVPGKHRYVYPLDRAMRRRIGPGLPYPGGP